MPELTTISVNDRETTPVAHDFAPYRKDTAMNMAVFREGAEHLIGNNTLSISSRDTGSRVIVRIRLDCPVVQVESLNGIDRPQIVRRSIADCTMTFEKSSSLQERKNLIGMFANLFDPSQVAVDKVVTAVESFF